MSEMRFCLISENKKGINFFIDIKDKEHEVK